jgi:hypothetical protein
MKDKLPPSHAHWNHGKMKKMVRTPRRERLLIQQALSNLKVRYWEQVQFWNPAHLGRHRHLNGGYQWIDFLLYVKPIGFMAILFKPGWFGSGPHEFQRREFETKKAFLEQKGYPYLVVSRSLSRDEYQIRIEFWILKEKRKHEKQNLRRA